MIDSISAEAQGASSSRLARFRVLLGLALGPLAFLRLTPWSFFGNGRLSVAEMMRAEALVGLAAILVITLVVFVLAMPVRGFGWSA